MSTIAPLKPPSQAMIEAHRRLLSLPGVRSNPARVAEIRAILQSWGVDPDHPASVATDDGWAS